MKQGQAVLLVVLILGVVMVVGLSIASRSVTEVNISTTQEESIRALEAAEAGIEETFGGVIVGVGGEGNIPTTNAKYNVSNVNLGDDQYYEVPFLVDQGEAVTVDLTGYTGDEIRVCWVKNDTQQPAVEAVLFYSDTGETIVGRAGYDAASPVRSSFTAADAGGCGSLGYGYSKNLLFSDLGMISGTPLVLRVRPVYNENAVKLAFVAPAGSTIPVQAVDVVSTGQSGATVQKLHATITNWDLPAMFDMALFSGGEITQ